MKTDRRIHRKRSFGRNEVFVILGASAVAVAIAARATQPALKITPSGPGYMLISVTNATPSNSFDIFFTPNFNPGYVWNFYAAGSVGQSNFTVPIVSLPSGFYIADLSSDFDGDGIPNWEDANPNNPNIGILTVIIDSPTNGYTFR